MRAATAVPGCGILAHAASCPNPVWVSMLYFAYGSNLDLDQMLEHVPGVFGAPAGARSAGHDSDGSRG